MAAAYDKTHNVTVSFSSSTSLSITAPTRASGDYLLVTLWIENTTKTPTTPSGWTAVGSIESVPKEGVNTVEVFFYVRKADNTSTDNFLSSWTGSSPRLGVMRRITGATGGYVAGTAKNGGSSVPIWLIPTIPANKSVIGIGTHVAAQPSTLSTPPFGWVNDSAEYPAISRSIPAEEDLPEELEGSFSESEQWMTKMFFFYEESEAEKTNFFVYTGSEWKEVTWKVF